MSKCCLTMIAHLSVGFSNNDYSVGRGEKCIRKSSIPEFIRSGSARDPGFPVRD